jgi:hypothetical protein
MKIIDLSSIRNENGKIPFRLWISRSLTEGLGWRTDLDAQDQVVPILERVLGNEFTLVREVKLPGLETPIPMVLIGPPGVYVLYATGVKGTFRARGDAWLILDGSGNMHTAHPNLPTRARLYAEAIRKFLAQNGFNLMEIEPVLLFSRPEAFVENIKSPIRIVMCDGLESYAGSLRIMNTLFSPMECSGMVNLIANPEGKRALEDEEGGVAAEEEITPQEVIQPSVQIMEEIPSNGPKETLQSSFTDEVFEEPDYRARQPEAEVEEVEEPEPPPEPRPRPSISGLLARTNMNSRQITLLGVFTLLDLLTICALLVFVLLTLAR